ncbi:MAG: response regulator [Butyrivibrio sp.]|nr:response regulator [Muribaculum sp.]MCM1552622.1 response regulator [Butyrivibrio sp.]
MKYKILLIGRYTALMDMFFTHVQGNFECYSCSTRTEDIFNHLKLFTPDALVYGLNKEEQDTINKVLACKNRLLQLEIPLVIIGSYEECTEFNINSGGAAKLVITRPFTASSMMEKLEDYLYRNQRVRDVQKDIKEIQEGKITPTETGGAGETGEAKPAESEKKRILVVDDDPLMLKIIKEHLHASYEVGTALNGKIAMKFLEKKTVDLILLDYEMPDEKGPEVLQKIHDNESTKDIPVLFLTGVTEKKKIQQALIQKPQGYILKPINKDKLMESIKKFV